jgi:hypothetical protein
MAKFALGKCYVGRNSQAGQNPYLFQEWGYKLDYVIQLF